MNVADRQTDDGRATATFAKHQACNEYRTLADISRSRYVAIATKPAHRLQIRPIVHFPGHPLPFPKVTSGSVQ